MSADLTVRPYSSAKEREKFEQDRDLFALIVSLEHLEKAYLRNAFSADVYTKECTTLIAQFKTARIASDYKTWNDVKAFVARYDVNCPLALHRLEIGVPSTVEFGGGGSGGGKTAAQAKDVAETVHHFITLMDILKMNLVAVDQVFPELNELMECLNRIPTLPPDFSGRVKAREWLATLNRMAAHEELGAEQARQLLMDMESAYNGFHRALSQ